MKWFYLFQFSWEWLHFAAGITIRTRKLHVRRGEHKQQQFASHSSKKSAETWNYKVTARLICYVE